MPDQAKMTGTELAKMLAKYKDQPVHVGVPGFAATQITGVRETPNGPMLTTHPMSKERKPSDSNSGQNVVVSEGQPPADPPPQS